MIAKSGLKLPPNIAGVFVRCQASHALEEEERFNGNPLRYHTFIRKVQDRILSVHARTNPGHADNSCWSQRRA